MPYNFKNSSYKALLVLDFAESEIATTSLQLPANQGVGGQLVQQLLMLIKNRADGEQKSQTI